MAALAWSEASACRFRGRGGRPLVWAHRGNSREAPENTIEAFRTALEAGADGVELDVHLSSDGHAVVIHDATLDRTTAGGARGSVSSRSLEELRLLSVGPGGEPLPTLEEALKLVMEWPGSDRRLLIELKGPFAGLPAALGTVLRRSGVLHHEAPAYSKLPMVVEALLKPYEAEVRSGRIMVQSFYMPYLKELRGMLPDLPLLYLTLSTTSGWLEKEHVMETAVSLGLLGVSVRHTSLSEAIVARFHSLGLLVFAWTVDAPSAMVLVKSKGADGIITNCPGVAVATLPAESNRDSTPRVASTEAAAQRRSTARFRSASLVAAAGIVAGFAVMVRRRPDSVYSM